MIRRPHVFAAARSGLVLSVLAGLGLLCLSCGSDSPGDPHASVTANPCGSGKRIRDVVDPKAKAAGSTVTVTCASHTWTDTFDETRDGKSRGAIYVQDIGSQADYGGISLYSPTFIPSNLHLSPGDVLDLTGQFVELDHVGTAMFAAGKLLQLSKPMGTFRYEYAAPVPRVIDAVDLDDPVSGRRFQNMLVTIKNVTIGSAVQDDLKGRLQWNLTPSKSGAAGVLENELYDMPADGIKKGDTFASITGVVTYFFSLHLCPRSEADLVK